MADIVDRATRSRMMSGIRGKNTNPELIVRKHLHAEGFRFRLHDRSLPGAPDLVLPKYNAAVQVRGCFWHQHAACKYAYMPKSNTDFWCDKLEGNVARDAKKDEALRELGWRVFVVWECDTSEELLDWLVTRIRDTTFNPKPPKRI
jgi:DNA mismatch endonuclease, patch repair protein